MRIEPEIKDGYIDKLFIDEKDIINPWSIEAADSYSAFRLTDDGLRIERQHNFNFDKKKNILKGNLQVRARQGEWNIKYSDNIRNNSIERKASLKAVKDSYLMDFVIRYRFKKDFFDYGLINKMRIEPKSSFTYHQFETNHAELVGKNFKCTIKFTTSKKLNGKKYVMYISDKSDEWVVHCRILPEDGDDYTLKLSTFWYDKALPKFISKPVIQNEKLRNFLLYRGERKPYKKPFSLLAPNVYPLMFLNEGQIISIESTCEFTK